MLHPQLAAPGYNLKLHSTVLSSGAIYGSKACASMSNLSEQGEALMQEALLGSSNGSPTGHLQEAIAALLKLYMKSPVAPSSKSPSEQDTVSVSSVGTALSQEADRHGSCSEPLGLPPPPGLGEKQGDARSTPSPLRAPPGLSDGEELQAHASLHPEKLEGMVDSQQGFGLATPLSPGLQVPGGFISQAFGQTLAPQFCYSNWNGQDLTRDAQRGPDIQQARDIATAGWGLSGYATVMIQQIPFKYTQKEFMNEINLEGFEGTYDFLYLPVDARNPGNRGFGFINFLSASFADQFYRKYHGKKLRQYEASTDIGVIPADAQGFEQSAAVFFASWHLRKKNRNSKPVFLRPVPAYLRQEGSQRGKSNAREAHLW